MMLIVNHATCVAFEHIAYFKLRLYLNGLWEIQLIILKGFFFFFWLTQLLLALLRGVGNKLCHVALDLPKSHTLSLHFGLQFFEKSRKGCDWRCFFEIEYLLRWPSCNPILSWNWVAVTLLLKTNFRCIFSSWRRRSEWLQLPWCRIRFVVSLMSGASACECDLYWMLG